MKFIESKESIPSNMMHMKKDENPQALKTGLWVLVICRIIIVL